MSQTQTPVEERIKNIIWDEAEYPGSIITTRKKIKDLIQEVCLEVIGENEERPNKNNFYYRAIVIRNNYRRGLRQKLKGILK